MTEKISLFGKQILIQWHQKELFQSDQPVLLFLHEALGSIAQWKTFPSELSIALKMPALVYDRFGSGGSDPMDLPRKKGYLEHEAFVVLPELVSKLGLKNLILIGHSDGASIALLYASKFQSNTKLLISEATHVFVEEVGLKGLAQAKILFETTSLLQKLEKYHGKKTKDLFYAWNNTWSSLEYRDWNMEGVLHNIKCPVLVIQGEDDEYASLEQVTRVSKQVGGISEEFIIPKCAHIPHMQAKKAVLDKMSGFIRKYFNLENPMIKSKIF